MTLHENWLWRQAILMSVNFKDWIAHVSRHRQNPFGRAADNAKQASGVGGHAVNSVEASNFPPNRDLGGFARGWPSGGQMVGRSWRTDGREESVGSACIAWRSMARGPLGPFRLACQCHSIRSRRTGPLSDERPLISTEDGMGAQVLERHFGRDAYGGFLPV